MAAEVFTVEVEEGMAAVAIAEDLFRGTSPLAHSLLERGTEAKNTAPDLDTVRRRFHLGDYVP